MDDMPPGFEDADLRSICEGRCGDFGDPPCWRLPSLSSDCRADEMGPCAECLRDRGLAAPPGWNPAARRPRAYEPIDVLDAGGRIVHGLCYSGHRGEIIKPITNLAAEPVIGAIVAWRYSPPAV